MSEPLDQPVVDAPIAGADAGVDAANAAPATNDDDNDTEAFDRMDAPDDDDAGAGDGQPGGDNDGDAPAAGADEIEFEADDGTKLKVPKALEPLLLRQKDYTQKTQAVAEQARALAAKESELAAAADQQAESLKTLRNEHIALHQVETSLAGIDAELAEYRKYTPAVWEATKAENKANYDAHLERYKELQGMRTITADAVEAAKTALAARETSLTESRTAAETAKLNDDWKQANEVLKVKIEGWSPDKFKEIGTFVNKEFGITAEQLRTATDPNAWTMANRLMNAEAELATLRTNAKQAKATETALKPQAVTPAVKPAGGGAKPTGVTDDLSDPEWFRRRALQKARRASK